MDEKSMPKIMNHLAQKVDQQIAKMLTEDNSSVYSNGTSTYSSTLTYEDIIKTKEDLFNRHKQVQCLPRILATGHMTERVLTKKPRKKKNRRWDKKYWKKYSKVQPRKDVIYDKINNVIYCHPMLIAEVKEMFKTQQNIN